MPRFLLRIASFIAVLVAVQLTGRSQGVVPRAVPVAPVYSPYQPGGSGQYGAASGERNQVVDPDKKLSAGDQVTLEIVEDKEGGLPRVVTAAGAIDVPPLGRVQVSGKTTAEATADIKRRLEADYYYHATVRLNIDRVSPQIVQAGTVTVSGDVRVPGPQQMIAGEPLTLSIAIQKAGNFTEWGNQKRVKLTRQVNGKAETKEYNVREIIEKGDVKADPVLLDGDRIFVPKSLIRF
jgi:protein involved in polysaccharide export with SLBB domain